MKDGLLKMKRYFAEVWGEVRPREGKVSWPGHEDVQGSTWVVVVTVGIIGVYLGAIDLMIGYVMSWLLGIG